MKEQFLICGRLISVSHPGFINRGGYWSLFAASSLKKEPDVSVNCTVCEALSTPSARLVGKTSDCAVSALGETVFREYYFGTLPGTLSRYSVGGKAACEVSVLSKDYSLALGDRYMWSALSFTQLLLKERVLLLHASYISYKNKAILFSAPSGTGKSTQASLWERFRGAAVINGDKAALSFDDGGVAAHSVPLCGTSGICQNKSYPLGAVVLLKQGKRDSVRRLFGVEAILSVHSNVHLDGIAPGERERCVDLLEELLKTVPVFELTCTPSVGAVACLESALESNGVF